MTPIAELPPSVKALAKREADRLLHEVGGLSAVVVATADGFDVASALRSGDASRIAAMASSISAISTVVSQEAHLGRNKSVTIDTEAGFALVRTVYRQDMELVINVIAGADAILGQVAYQTSQLARSLEQA